MDISIELINLVNLILTIIKVRAIGKMKVINENKNNNNNNENKNKKQEI